MDKHAELNKNSIQITCEKDSVEPFLIVSIYRCWGDKTSYLKNVKCSGERENMAAKAL